MIWVRVKPARASKSRHSDAVRSRPPGNMNQAPASMPGKRLANKSSGGTIFKITPSGQLTTLYSFCAQINCPDGQNPSAGLVQGTDGNLYGTTAYGGGNGCSGGCGTCSVSRWDCARSWRLCPLPVKWERWSVSWEPI